MRTGHDTQANGSLERAREPTFSAAGISGEVTTTLGDVRWAGWVDLVWPCLAGSLPGGGGSCLAVPGLSAALENHRVCEGRVESGSVSSVRRARRRRSPLYHSLPGLSRHSPLTLSRSGNALTSPMMKAAILLLSVLTAPMCLNYHY